MVSCTKTGHEITTQYYMKNIPHALQPVTSFYSRVRTTTGYSATHPIDQTEKQQLYYNKCEVSGF